ncbi:ABC transporter ATP-binding protein [Fusobacterium pseudoperiodonticum]|uniref:ABC transporter n=1 Tax=Fusobacterium pseudoperiodonticum TaxID=2663009 RepID=A0A2G9EH60_9FUSO|nr:ABC transporter ATP-binding protein [Fusobacterium pseudoperiodonticum]ATV56541.1 ABC transporter [Fusobacterium pseudoperiodonticum]ATV68893.1 ABC transporter ATP-binding protein [Fusobacterium pseudoperiodonticum]PIM80218.1 ABC transporter [Fusobacterium pseudoperiodonticum]
MKILRTYIKENIGILSLGAIFLTLNTFATLAIPFQISNIINLGIMKKDIDMVYSTSIKMVIILIVGTATGIIANHFVALFATNFTKKNRKLLIRNLESLTVDQVNDFGVASLVTRMGNDNNNAQRLIVAFFQMILPSPIMAVISIFMTIKLSPTLALIPLFTILVFTLAIVLTLFKSLPYILKVQKKLDRMTLVLRERFIGAKIIRAFDNSKKERDKFNDVAQEYTDNYIIINKKFALLSPMAFALMSIVITLIIFFGAMKVLNNTLEIGSITAIVEYSLTTIAALIMSSMVLVQMPKAVVSIERIEEVLNVTSEIKDKEELKDNSYYEDILKQNPISLTFDNVCFRYKGAEKQILKNISFSIKAGERFAIVGATGSGKSTIAKVLLRLNDIESGRILINGVDALDLPLNCLRNQISYTPQKAYIFSGKIKDNFRFTNKNMTDEEMIKIAKIAQSYDFIDSLPDKFDSFVAQGGINFSGGQKQRLSIARALSKDANIYLFDDSFSALDYATDAKLRKELKTFLKDKITIIIAQRLNTIADADKIIVLKDSEITGMGTHQELLESNQEYIELAKSQGILE